MPSSLKIRLKSEATRGAGNSMLLTFGSCKGPSAPRSTLFGSRGGVLGFPFLATADCWFRRWSGHAETPHSGAVPQHPLQGGRWQHKKRCDLLILRRSRSGRNPRWIFQRTARACRGPPSSACRCQFPSARWCWWLQAPLASESWESPSPAAKAVRKSRIRAATCWNRSIG